ncbi:PREDICTED: transcription factor E2F8 [Nanorana parkeri]|uniref:transcription factor E2F8 n=1 Tax=Nanorana parkeri TaxID=125878 RepID=UPI000855076E|nr:PREDICTED: transcription factor E2F8 [Nanorana parkeri]
MWVLSVCLGLSRRMWGTLGDCRTLSGTVGFSRGLSDSLGFPRVVSLLAPSAALRTRPGARLLHPSRYLSNCFPAPSSQPVIAKTRSHVLRLRPIRVRRTSASLQPGWDSLPERDGPGCEGFGSTVRKVNLQYGLHLNKRISRTPSKQPTLVLSELQCAAAALKTPTKPPEVSNSDPWTPTANLKMLISAASPEIRNREREMLEEQFSGDELEKTLPSRKEKSLGLLCHKFLARYPDYPNPAVNNSICLDEVAGELSVERRRIYDIVNVLESLHMVSRLAKNKYIWHGRHNLNKTFEALRQVGEECKYTDQILHLKKREQEEPESLDEAPIPKSLVKQTEISFVELPGLEFRAASVNSRKEKSLRVMSQRFVMLFLVSKPQIVSLEIAAKILIGEDQIDDLDKSKFKTKIRRLYDIANVLSSLGLIKKVHVTEERGRKPAFQWTGPDACTEPQESFPGHILHSSVALDLRSPKENCAKNLFSSRGKQSFTRHQSLIKLARSIENDRRKINSAPSSPVKSADSSDPSVPSKMAQLAAICKEQLDQTKDVKKMKIKMSRGAPSGNTKVILKPQNAQLQPLSPVIYQALPLVQPHANSPTPYAVYLQHPHSIQGHTILSAQKPVLEAAHGEKNALEDDKKVPVSGGPAENDSPHEKCYRKLPEPDNSGSKRIKVSGQEDLAERMIPSGYLIPLQLASIGNESGKDHTTSCTDQKIFTSPVTGLIPLKFMLSPGSVAPMPGTASGSSCPSPGILNFTLHNKDLISPPCGSSHPITISPRNRKHQEELQAAQMLNFKHLSPIPYHGQPFTLFAVPQAGVPLTPKGSQPLKDNFFRTPGGVTSSPIASATPNGGSQGPVYISQRKLDVGGED